MWQIRRNLAQQTMALIGLGDGQVAVVLMVVPVAGTAAARVGMGAGALLTLPIS